MGKADTNAPKLRYTPALDGLRAVAVLLVFVFHIPGTVFYLPTGSVGVDVFFVLSGFLITSLLVEERAEFGRIDLPKFYMRRFLRLVPALVVALIGVAIIGATKTGAERSDILLDVLAVGTYTSNWVYAFEWLPALYLQHSWSLAVEEQYYLLWALAVVALLGRSLRPQRIVVVALVGAAASILWRLVLLVVFDASYERVYFGLDTRLDGLLFGSAVGALRYTPAWDRVLRLAHHRLAGPTALALFGLLIVGTRINVPGNLPTFAVVLPAVAVVTAIIAVVLVESPQHLLHGALSWPPLVRLGRLSYGFYLFHIPVVRVLREWLDPQPEVLFVLAFAVTYGLAEASFRLVEQPMLQRKDKFRPQRAAAPLSATT